MSVTPAAIMPAPPAWLDVAPASMVMLDLPMPECRKVTVVPDWIVVIIELSLPRRSDHGSNGVVQCPLWQRITFGDAGPWEAVL